MEGSLGLVALVIGEALVVAFAVYQVISVRRGLRRDEARRSDEGPGADREDHRS